VTFDDGTIENYTLVYPLLKAYGFKGTVFAPTADGYLQKSGSHWWKEVETEGTLKIEGHSHMHALIFVNDHVEDFYEEGKAHTKPVIKGLDPRPGAPIFGLGYELVSQRFIPDSKWMDLCVDYAGKEGRTFFDKRDWKEELMNHLLSFEGNRGRYEMEDEKRKRIQKELELSGRMIEEVIGSEKKVHFFAYPFGAYNSDLIESLKEMGYWSALTTEPGGNLKGDHPYLLKRMMILSEDSFGGLEKILSGY
jgi:peptidoglycan/xylan/chitin deacetylase (PgdA/CDA1 family)